MPQRARLAALLHAECCPPGLPCEAMERPPCRHAAEVITAAGVQIVDEADLRGIADLLARPPRAGSCPHCGQATPAPDDVVHAQACPISLAVVALGAMADGRAAPG